MKKRGLGAAISRKGGWSRTIGGGEGIRESAGYKLRMPQDYGMCRNGREVQTDMS